MCGPSEIELRQCPARVYSCHHVSTLIFPLFKRFEFIVKVIKIKQITLNHFDIIIIVYILFSDCYERAGCPPVEAADPH